MAAVRKFPLAFDLTSIIKKL